jgi:hypothetical protein
MAIVVEAGYRFRAVNNAKALHDSVTSTWEMLPPKGESVLAEGLEFLIVDEQGHIRAYFDRNAAMHITYISGRMERGRKRLCGLR